MSLRARLSSLGTRIALGTAMGFIVGVGSALTLLATNNDRTTHTLMTEGDRQVTMLLADQLSGAVRFGKADTVDQVYRKLTDQEGARLLGIVVLKADGSVITGQRSERVGEAALQSVEAAAKDALARGEPVRTTYQGNDLWAQPVLFGNDGTKVGSLAALWDTQSVRDAASVELMQAIAVSAAVALGVLALLLVFVNRAVLKPLDHLSAQLARLGEGDADIDVPAFRRRDEIARCYESLAALRSSVSEAFRLKQMVDEMPLNIMTADPDGDVRINYVNKAALATLRPLEAHMSRAADRLVGESIGVLHSELDRQRSILSNPDRLPWNAKIKLGPETMDLRVSAVRDRKGRYMGPMLSWTVITAREALADDFEASVKTVVDQVSRGAQDMIEAAKTMSATAEETASQASTVAAAATQATTNVQTVAAASEELSSSIAEISRQVSESSVIASRAVSQAQQTNEQVEALSEGARRIGDVVKLISDIAAQTNLLALNATIEAARAGEMGKGFAVVASEVKNLATQTAKATEDIAEQIGSIQTSTEGAVEAIKEIQQTITRMHEISAGIAAAVEEQDAATKEISRNVAEAATGTTEVSRNIEDVTIAAGNTGQTATHVLGTANALSVQAAALGDAVSRFVENVRAA